MDTALLSALVRRNRLARLAPRPGADQAPPLPRWRLVFALLALGATTACMEGYPTQDVAAVDPLYLTQDQRLAQLNALGSDAHPERKWSYAMRPGCVLRIDFDGKAGLRPPFDIPLRGAVVKVATDKADQTFDVEVKPVNPGAPHQVTVLEAQDWALAVGMSRVLRVMEKGCTDEGIVQWQPLATHLALSDF